MPELGSAAVVIFTNIGENVHNYDRKIGSVVLVGLVLVSILATRLGNSE